MAFSYRRNFRREGKSPMTIRMLGLFCLFCSTTVLAQAQTPSSASPDTNPANASSVAPEPSVVPAAAQETPTALHHRPASFEPPGNPAPDPAGFHPKLLTGSESLPSGMVWVPTGDVWSAREANSCFWCSKPMTFRRALLDKKGLGMWGTALALTVADIEVLASRQCYKAGTCREGNPVLGQTRTQQYGVRLPLLAGAWLGTAWLRKGDRHLHVGGMKYWWILPAAYQATSTAGVISNLTHVH